MTGAEEHRSALTALEQALGLHGHGWRIADVRLGQESARLLLRRGDGDSAVEQGVTIASDRGQPAYKTAGGVALSYQGKSPADGILAVLDVIAGAAARKGWDGIVDALEAAGSGASKPSEPAARKGHGPSALQERLVAQHFVPLNAEFDPSAALAEIEALRSRWHVEKQRGVDGPATWWSLPLRTRGGRSDHGWYFEPTGPDRPDWHWTEHAKACPSVVAIVEQLTVAQDRRGIHAMILAGGGRVVPHSDEPDKACSVSISAALSHPHGCVFTIGCDESGARVAGTRDVPFAPGRAFVLNVARYHRIDHAGDALRVHLVIRATPRTETLAGVI